MSADLIEALESLGLVVASGVGIAGTLSVLAHTPGTRIVFRRLVRDPIAEWLDERMDQKITAEISLESEASNRIIEHAVAKAIDAIATDVAGVRTDIAAINLAVNNVDPGVPPIKQRVATIERGVAETNSQLSTILSVVEALASRP
jgi:hypothetical protein